MQKIKKIVGAIFEKNRKMLILGPKMTQFGQFGQNMIFTEKSGIETFHALRKSTSKSNIIKN